MINRYLTIVLAVIIFAFLWIAMMASVARAASEPPGEIDWKSPDVITGDADEIKLPPGKWCLIMSVRNNYGEPRTLTYQRGTFDWCNPKDRVFIRNKEKAR
jgi:hypothetical protein